MTRAEKVAEAQRLRAEGLTQPQIAERMGVSRQSVYTYLTDPDLSKQCARRAGYAGACRACGAPTDGSNGRAAAPAYCANCAPDAYRVWTRETVIAAIQRWAAEHGRPPRAADWKSAVADYPHAGSVYCHGSARSAPFASWADAVEAAGFPRPWTGAWAGNAEPWSRTLIIDAIRSWVAEHGDIPSTRTWARSGEGHPVWMTVAYHFGSWNAAIKAAGFTPRRRIGAA